MKKLICYLFLLTLLVAVPLSAQDFKSTSAMQPTGTNYTPSITPVGSQTPNYVGSPMGSLPASPMERQRAAMEEDDFDSPEETNRSDQFPIGDAWIMLLFAAIGMSVVAIKKRKAQKAQ